ncbi:MAG: hypothetical protein Q9160_002281 [Pyrenula sp. 1 TL-2023]
MSIEALLSRVHDLSDLELASLLCLAAKEHCLVETNETLLDGTAQELSLHTSIEEFGDAILDQSSANDDDGSAEQAEGFYSTTSSRLRLSSLTIKAAPRDPSAPRLSTSGLDNRKIVNVVIAKNFNLVDDVVQIQALELDYFFISHFHGAEDGFRYLEDATGYLSSSTSQSSLASVVYKPSRSTSQVGGLGPHKIPLEVCKLYFLANAAPIRKGALTLFGSESVQWILHDTIDRNLAYGAQNLHMNYIPHSTSLHRNQEPNRETRHAHRLKAIKSLQTRTSRIYTSPEIRRYIQNIVVFLRLERGVAGGVSPKATSHFQLLTK